MVWKFSTTKDDYDLRGLNDSGIETFNDDRLKGVAREICQNSLDARNPDLSNDQPVIVEFSRFKTPSTELPGYDTLLSSLKEALEYWAAREASTTVEFFQNAIETISAPTLEWLRVSDFNTTGLKGVSDRPGNDRATPWRNLVMSSGVSDKPESDGGSFGIGKSAAFTCSLIRTCFYSTTTIDAEKGYQGVARLLSFRKKDSGEVALGNGYYRNEDYSPINGNLMITPTFNRGERSGTDIFIPAFIQTDNSWKDEIKKSVVNGFMYAIFKGMLEVRLIDENGETQIIDKHWLEAQFKNEEAGEFQDVAQYYRALTGLDEKFQFTKEYPGEGVLELKLLLGEGLCRTIAMIRQTGMTIYAAGGFPRTISFAGVLIVHGAKLNQRVKKFENPQHTKWEPRRNISDKKILSEINSFCKKSLESLVENPSTEEFDAGLGNLLPATGPFNGKEERETLTPKIETLTTKKRRHKRPVSRTDAPDDDGEDPTISTEKGDDGGKGGSNESKNHGGKIIHRRPGTLPGDGNGINGGEGEGLALKKVSVGKIRIMCSNPKEGHYTMFVLPNSNVKKAALKLNAVAELNTYEAEILSAKLENGEELTVKKNLLTGLSFKKGQLIKINLVLGYDDYISMEADWYGLA